MIAITITIELSTHEREHNAGHCVKFISAVQASGDHVAISACTSRITASRRLHTNWQQHIVRQLFSRHNDTHPFKGGRCAMHDPGPNAAFHRLVVRIFKPCARSRGGFVFLNGVKDDGGRV